MYQIKSTFLFTVVHGVVNKRLQHELTWERLVNLSGRPGGNIGLDLCNEFLNNQFKGNSDIITPTVLMVCTTLSWRGGGGVEFYSLITRWGTVPVNVFWFVVHVYCICLCV